MKFNCIFHIKKINVFGQKRQNVNINVNLRFFSLIVVNSDPFLSLIFSQIDGFIYAFLTLFLTLFDGFIYVNNDGFTQPKTNKL
jgi:hypothetical protein